MSKGYESIKSDNGFSIQHALCGSYDFVLVPSHEGLFYALTAIRKTEGGSLEEASNILLHSAVSALNSGIAPNKLNGVLAYRILIGIADGDELAVKTELSADDFVSHPNPMVRQTVAATCHTKATMARLLTDPELSVQYMTVVASDYDTFSEAQRDIVDEILTEILLNPDCSERAADLAMASVAWPPTLIAAVFCWDIMSERYRNTWATNEQLWGRIAKSGKMTVWSCETVQAQTATYRHDWREWYEVFGGMYHTILDAFNEFLTSRSVIVYSAGA